MNSYYLTLSTCRLLHVYFTVTRQSLLLTYVDLTRHLRITQVFNRSQRKKDKRQNKTKKVSL